MTFSGVEISEFLGARLGKVVAPFLRPVLLDPANDLLSRGSKNLRGQLVRIGFACGDRGERRLLHWGENLMERLHAGSLIVDDIEDNSELRRGLPCLHKRFGTPIALNTGNWLYFWPLFEGSQMGLTPMLELEVYRRYHRTLLSAHIGQALDVGVRIDEVKRDLVADLCLASLELKSGALTALGVVIGAVLSGAGVDRVKALEDFGTRFGVALQMFDDLGNFRGSKEPSKQYEDLRLRRPSWIWAIVARDFPDRFAGFCEAVALLPDRGAVDEWAKVNESVPRYAKERAVVFLNDALSDLEKGPVPQATVHSLRDLSVRLAEAYG
ncbi:MAG: polyprenyl synthetase family protein [Deltaproteobacteria bacterium]|nr:polyprenyl synthetase family protein [Deltaproteobacteria bacterium]